MTKSMKNIMKGIVPVVSLLSFVAFCPVAVADEAAEKILQHTRFAATLQQQDLHGSMKKNGVKTPIALFLRGKDIQFSYQLGDQNKRFHMRLDEKEHSLFNIVGNKHVSFNDTQIAEKINGTDLSFEDLSMRFLYWQKSSVVGEDKISRQKCHIIRLENPGTTGDYAIVQVWVHQKYGSLMRVIGYNAAGHPLKQFEVTDLMKVNGEYTLKRMRVDSMSPDTNKSVGFTYLEFDKPKKAPIQGR